MASVYNRGTRDNPIWWVGYKEDGRWRYIKSKQLSRAEAKRFVEEIEARIRRGEVGITPSDAPPVITFRQLAEKFYGEYSHPRVKDIESYRRTAKYMLERHIVPVLGSMPADKVRPADIEALRDAGLSGAGRKPKRHRVGKGAKVAKSAASAAPGGYQPQTVKHWLMCLSRLYNWAIQKDILTCVNPVSRVDKPSMAGRDQDFDFLSQQEVERLLSCEAIPQMERTLYAVALYAGLRMGELYGLRWRDLDFERAQLSVKRSYTTVPKSGKSRHLPINARLLQLLRGWREACPTTAEGLVFPTPRTKRKRRDGTPGTYEPHMRVKDSDYDFAKHLAAAGCHKVRFHDTRHSFASHFMMSGGNILTLQKLLGHSSVAVTMRYAHLAPDFMRGEIERMSFESKAGDVVSLNDYKAERAEAAGQGEAGEPPLTTPVLRSGKEKGTQLPGSPTVSLEGIEPSTSGLRGASKLQD